MDPMHLRTLLKRIPHYENSLHIIHNERTVTKFNDQFKGRSLPCYVIQIAGKSVAGIDSHVEPGQSVSKGGIFGMIRIGSQVDLVAPWDENMQIKVRPSEKVRAGETVFIE